MNANISLNADKKLRIFTTLASSSLTSNSSRELYILGLDSYLITRKRKRKKVKTRGREKKKEREGTRERE